MGYLYGDSTAAPLDVDYITFLRDALDTLVEILLAADRMRGWEAQAKAEEQATQEEIRRLRSLQESLLDLLESPQKRADETSPTARVARAIGEAASKQVAGEVGAVNRRLQDELAGIGTKVSNERLQCQVALERLLLRHDLPDAQHGLRLQMTEGGYRARLSVESPLDLVATLELGIPDGHLLAQHVRVDRLTENLEVEAPEVRGWLQKKVKVVTHRLGKMVVAGFEHDEGRTVIQLRQGPSVDESGFDVVFAGAKPQPVIIAVDKKHPEERDPYEVSPGDAAKLRELRSTLLRELHGLARDALVDAALDETPMSEHEDPSVLVERLIASMTPVVQEIGRHSLAKDEFVLKRELDDSRREEIFVSKGDLRRKLEPLPEHLRQLFVPLGLGRIEAPAPAPSAPPPRPAAVRSQAARSEATESVDLSELEEEELETVERSSSSAPAARASQPPVSEPRASQPPVRKPPASVRPAASPHEAAKAAPKQPVARSGSDAE